MTSPPLRRFIEHALEVVGPHHDHAFPRCFDWSRICRDAPAMVERVTEGEFDPADARLSHLVTERADAIFRLAHLTTLAVLSAAEESSNDPESALRRFASPPDDDEEDRFAEFVRQNLDAVEESFEDEEQELEPEAEQVRELVTLVSPVLTELVDESGLLEPGGPDEEALAQARPVLGALARLAAILAAMRWLAGYAGADESVG